MATAATAATAATVQKEVKETKEQRLERLKKLFKTDVPAFWAAATISDARKVTGHADMKWEEYRKLKAKGLYDYWITKPAPTPNGVNTPEEAQAKLRAQMEKFKKKFPNAKFTV